MEVKMKIDYGYQAKAANKILTDALNPKYAASVLAACPGAGKTTISHIIINKYVELFPSAKILVLTEGQNTLKNQYLDELKNANVEINFTYGDFTSDAQVRVGIPQSIDSLDWDSVDLMIVDEAHRFFLAPMVTDIVNKLKPAHKVLMTGSPTEYNMINQSKGSVYAMYYIAAEELQKYGVFSAVDMDVVRTIDKKNPHKAIQSVMHHAKQNGDNMSKIMIACPTIDYARKVADHLKYVGRKVSLSTSKNDPEDEQIKEFKAGKTDTLIVVGKGVLGFNDKKITFLADLRSSNNIDTSYQLFARVLRTHPDNVKKTYVRIADKDFNKQVLTLHKMLALMKRNIFMGYNGNNLKLEVA